jgi:hypothetical protein
MERLPATKAPACDIEPLRGAGPRRVPLELVEPPPPALKALQLFEEARAVSLEHLRALEAAMANVRGLAEAVVDAGDLYVPGLREFARTLGEDLMWKSKTLELLSLRQCEALAMSRRALGKKAPSPRTA